MGTNINKNKYLSSKVSRIMHDVNTLCPFTIPEASTYWNALTAANGGIEVNGSIYGMSTCQLKTAIDTWFGDMQSQSIYSGFKAVYLYIGNTAATQAVNAITPGLYDLTFGNVPIHNSDGLSVNGFNQYADTNLNAATVLTIDNTQFSSYISGAAPPFAGFGNYIAAKDSIGTSANRVELAVSSALNLEGILYKAAPAGCALTSRVNYTTIGTINNKLSILSRPFSTNLYLYENGALVASAAGARCGTLPAFNLYIGAVNQVGTAAGFIRGTFGYSAIGDALAPIKIPAYNTSTLTLMATLGR